MTPPLDAVPEDAIRAWSRFRGVGEASASVRPLKHRPGKGTKSAVFLLEETRPAGRRVVAKLCPAHVARFEEQIYRQVLPEAGVPALRAFGILAARAGGRAWLFLEAAPGTACGAGSSYRHAITRWLAALHTGLAEAAAPRWLPRRDADSYLREVRRVRRALRRSNRNPAVKRLDLARIHSLVGHLSTLEASWEGLWGPFASLSSTLVHGDLVPKNVHVGSDHGPAYVFDWEHAGWGIPATDLIAVDGVAYAARANLFWPGCTQRDVERLVRLGVVLRIVIATGWAAAGLRWPWVDKPMRQLRVYERELDTALPSLLSGSPQAARRPRPPT